MRSAAHIYRRREPTRHTLYRVLQPHLETLLARVAAWRDHVVPTDEPKPEHVLLPTRVRRTPRRKRHPWAELMLRALRLDVLLCPCGARRALIALVTEPLAIRRILLHLELPADPPPIAPARAPPGTELFAT